MNAASLARIKCFIVLFIFMIIGIGPIPITSSIGLYVVVFRPLWFKKLVETVYADKVG